MRRKQKIEPDKEKTLKKNTPNPILIKKQELEGKNRIPRTNDQARKHRNCHRGAIALTQSVHGASLTWNHSLI